MVAAWRPGEEGGHAIVNILTGRANPSAKLAQSWPRTVGHVHSGSTPWLQRVRGKWVANGKGCNYDADGRCYDAYTSSGFAPTPLFYFGAGLSCVHDCNVVTDLTWLTVVCLPDCSSFCLSSNRYTSYKYSGLKVTPSAEVLSGAAVGRTFADTTDSDTVWQISVTGAPLLHCHSQHGTQICRAGRQLPKVA